MTSLKELKLILPQLPTEEKWIELINDLEGLTKEAAIVRAKGYNLLADLDESKATFERIGWLNLWTKAIVALESAMSAFQEGLNWVLQTIARSTFEWVLHAYALIEPISDLLEIEKSNRKVVSSKWARLHSDKMTVERLRAYAAWCLWSDKESYHYLIHPKTLKKIWDPIPAEKILADKNYKEDYEQLFGNIKVVTDHEILSKGQKEMDSLYRKKIACIDELLRDPQLKSWADKILEISRKKKGSVSFFNLFDPDATVIKKLKKLGPQFGYILYSEGSMALHGSSMEQFVIIDDSKVTPKINIKEQADERLFEKIISDCNRILVILYSIDHFLLKN
jgi:hypothetical protein